MRHRVSIFSLLVIALLFCSTLTAVAIEPAKPGKKDRCPVCGMFVYPYPDWQATLVFKDNSQVFFDGAKDLFRYYYSLPNKYDSRTRDTIEGIYLTDYYTTRLLPVKELFLVLGSDIYGPMGAEVIPIAGEDAAKTFARDHNGKQVISFEQLTPQLLPKN